MRHTRTVLNDTRATRPLTWSGESQRFPKEETSVLVDKRRIQKNEEALIGQRKEAGLTF